MLSPPLGAFIVMQVNINPNKFLDQDVAFDENSEGLVIERYQEIPQSFIDGLKAEKANSKSVREGEYMRVASIPVVVVEKWTREGFDFWNAPAREIVAKLRTEHLDDFITTNKAI
jgi:hypothetical protein